MYLAANENINFIDMYVGHPCAWHGEVDMMVVPNNASKFC